MNAYHNLQNKIRRITNIMTNEQRIAVEILWEEEWAPIYNNDHRPAMREWVRALLCDQGRRRDCRANMDTAWLEKNSSLERTRALEGGHRPRIVRKQAEWKKLNQ